VQLWGGPTQVAEICNGGRRLWLDGLA
jgi:hypothetical protein